MRIDIVAALKLNKHQKIVVHVIFFRKVLQHQQNKLMNISISPVYFMEIHGLRNARVS